MSSCSVLRFMIAVAVTLAAGCKATNRMSEERPAEGAASDAKAVDRCVTFDLLRPGTRFGAPAHKQGTVVLAEAGIEVTIHRIEYGGGKVGFTAAEINRAVAGFGHVNALRLNNITARFEFKSSNVQTVTFDYLDYGGVENLWINDHLVQAGELSAAAGSQQLPAGIKVTVNATPLPPNNRIVRGQVVIEGPITSVGVGGQELWIDNVCAR